MDLHHRVALALLPLCLSASLHAGPQDSGQWWVYFESRETKTGKPPRLRIVTKDKKSQELTAVADGPVISYLEGRNFARTTRLSTGLADKNRCLIRFELPEGLSAADLVSTSLLLDLKMSQMAPSRKFEISMHRVLEPWKEATLSWATQPSIDKEPAARIALQPGNQIVTVDVLPLVRSWLGLRDKNHGILLRKSGPLLPKAPPKKQLIARLRTQVGFAKDSTDALARAHKGGKLVLTLVVSSQNRGAAGTLEQLLLTQAFGSPEVLTLVHGCFVPLRVAYPPNAYTHKRPSRGRDPLAPLGATCPGIKAPALIVTTAKGKLLDSLQSIGTPDEAVVHRFLLRALAAASPVSPLPDASSEQLLAGGFVEAALEATKREKSPGAEAQRARIHLLLGQPARSVEILQALDKKWQDDPDVRLALARARMQLGDYAAARRLYAVLARNGRHQARARYFLAALDWHTGSRDSAFERWEDLSKDDDAGTWALRAAARITWPDRMDWGESLRAVPQLEAGWSTESKTPDDKAPALVRRSIGYLLEKQRPDGSWPIDSAQYRMAVSAFAAKALLTWRPDMDASLQARIGKALDRFDRYALAHLENQDPKQASTFGATYLTDYFLGVYSREKTKENLSRLTRAAEFLIGGQCPNGAWSYSYGFGTSWRGGFGGWPRTTRGRTHSMNTGPALDFLLAARKAGARLDDEAISRGLEVLAKMRMAAGVYTYTYPDPISFQRSDQSIARGPTCELALYLGDKASQDDLLITLRRFMELRSHLRTPVKLDPSWASPHNLSSYFFFYAYYHGALAWKALEGIEAHRTEAHDALRLLRKDLLEVAEIDGTWLDFPDLGKPYGTAAALLTLAMAR